MTDILETTGAERVASGFVFTEGPLWHPDDFWYFVDIRQNKLMHLTLGKAPELVRITQGGNGTSFDLQGRLINCEGEGRRVTRQAVDGDVEVLVDRYKGGRFARPNDVICHSNGTLYFTDPDKRTPYHEREVPGPDGIDNLWVVFYIIKHDMPRPIPYAEARDLVDQSLDEVVAERVLNEFLDRLRAKHHVEMHPELAARISLVDSSNEWNLPSGD